MFVLNNPLGESMKPETYPKYVANLVGKRPRKFCFSNRLIPTMREFKPRPSFYEPIRGWFPDVNFQMNFGMPSQRIPWDCLRFMLNSARSASRLN